MLWGRLMPVRAPSEQSRVHERLEESELSKVNLCASAAPNITGTSACFALSEHSIPAAPALRMPACGGRVGDAPSKQEFAEMWKSRMMATRVIGGFDQKGT
eukprot:scaffold4659_cov48-Phaeocystis_antarctica.AAC.1